jgi:TonB family protein
MRTLAAAILLVAASALVSASEGAADLDLARSRYQEAAYEDALKILDGVEASTASDRVQVEQYRALCHIALGHTEQAERAVIALVDADPTYLPPTTIASPRALAIVAEARRRHIPEVVRRLLDSGRAAFAERNMELAAGQFSLLLRLLDDAAMADRPERADFRTLAQGFVTLVSAPAPAPAPTAPASSTAAPPAFSPASGGSAAPAPREAAAPGPGVPRSFTPAVPLEETLPQWRPPNQTISRNEYAGSVKLQIGADGRVKSATVLKPSHPLYDAAVLGVVKTWRYKPAMQDGASTESERIIAIRLRPIS